MNNKSRIALAIAAAFGTAALGVSSGASAQTSTVQIGGSISLKYALHRNTGGLASGSKNSSNDNLSLNEPEIWIHGEEKIGSNLTAWFRCSSSFDVLGAGGGTQATPAGVAAAPATSQWCGRNSALGFKGGFGNVYFGNWDMPSKNVYNAFRGWFSGTDSLVGGFANVLLNTSSSNTTNVTATQASFVERRQRLIRYDSPSFSGFSVSAGYTAANESTGLSSAASQGLTPRALSLSGEYKNGPLYLGIGYDRHNDHNPGAGGTVAIGTGALQYNGGSDTNWMFGAGYTFGFGMKLTGLITRSKYDVTNTTDLKKNGYAVAMDYAVSGPHSIKAMYFAAGDSKGTSATAVGAHQAVGPSTGAKGWNLGYMYAMSKRTQIGVMYSVIDNDTNAKYGKGIQSATLGQTQKVYGMNVRHSF